MFARGVHILCRTAFGAAEHRIPERFRLTNPAFIDRFHVFIREVQTAVGVFFVAFPKHVIHIARKAVFARQNCSFSCVIRSFFYKTHNAKRLLFVAIVWQDRDFSKNILNQYKNIFVLIFCFEKAWFYLF